jgi:hypothetical protein
MTKFSEARAIQTLATALDAHGVSHRPSAAGTTLIVGETGHRLEAVAGGGYQVDGGPYFADAEQAAESLAEFEADHG